jgi:hypothetical protein
MPSTPSQHSENVLTADGIAEPDVELAKADLAARIHRLLEQNESRQTKQPHS